MIFLPAVSSLMGSGVCLSLHDFLHKAGNLAITNSGRVRIYAQLANAPQLILREADDLDAVGRICHVVKEIFAVLGVLLLFYGYGTFPFLYLLKIHPLLDEIVMFPISIGVAHATKRIIDWSVSYMAR